MNLFVLVLAPFAGALVIAMLGPLGLDLWRGRPAVARSASAWIAGIFTAVALALTFVYAPPVLQGEVPAASVPWLPMFGVNFGFRLDGLALLFALLILGIGLLIILYAAYYLSDAEPNPKFFAYLLLFMGSMLGLCLADNLILLVVFWELTSIASFLLIGFWNHRDDARQGARMALALTGAGGLALLGGLIMIGQMAGTWQLDGVLNAKDVIQAHPDFPIALTLVLLGAFTKSAQFPFHFWLPHAMAAPTPVSAYLHSATMVKAGVFLLARLWPILSGGEIWFVVVSSIGLTTLLVGAYYAIVQHDLKGLLAYSTISHLGLITLLFGLGSPLAAVAAVFHIINHATFKASLFMAAGIIDHECGSRDMRKLHGLFRYMPYTATLAIVGSLAMAGVPLLNGFLSKEMFLAEAVAIEGRGFLNYAIPIGATLAGILAVAYSLRFVHDVFFNGEPVGLTAKPHEPPRWMKVPVEALVILCVLVGIAPALVVGPLLAAAAGAVIGGPLPNYSLAIWHGFNLPLLMSLIALAGGVLLYFGLQKFFDLHQYVSRFVGGKVWFEKGLRRAIAAANRITLAMHAGQLQTYLFWVVVTALVAGLIPLIVWPTKGFGGVSGAAASLPEIMVWTIGAFATLATVVWHRERLVALVAMGAAGLVVSLVFVYFSAPDLALTQLLVEVVSIVLMMLALRFLPAQSAPERAPIRKLRDAMLAGAAGIAVAWIVYAILTRPFDSIAQFFLDRTISEGGGANAVNVIIVDFRGFDTFGEMTVLGVAGLVVFALLRDAFIDLPTAKGDTARPLMLNLAARFMLPMCLVASLYFFLRGHNLPGGGFIAGLLTAIGLIVQFVARGPAELGRAIEQQQNLIGWGLLVAFATGVGAWVWGYPFLTSTYGHPVVPVLGELPLASASLFDLGVYLAVVGATVVALAALGRAHPSKVAEVPT
jgi:multicomponent K+:H+ antiporter subunit A